jgi:hypothetical protein
LLIACIEGGEDAVCWLVAEVGCDAKSERDSVRRQLRADVFDERFSE